MLLLTFAVAPLSVGWPLSQPVCLSVCLLRGADFWLVGFAVAGSILFQSISLTDCFRDSLTFKLKRMRKRAKVALARCKPESLDVNVNANRTRLLLYFDSRTAVGFHPIQFSLPFIVHTTSRHTKQTRL